MNQEDLDQILSSYSVMEVRHEALKKKVQSNPDVLDKQVQIAKLHAEIDDINAKVTELIQPDMDLMKSIQEVMGVIKDKVRNAWLDLPEDKKKTIQGTHAELKIKQTKALNIINSEGLASVIVSMERFDLFKAFNNGAIIKVMEAGFNLGDNAEVTIRTHPTIKIFQGCMDLGLDTYSLDPELLYFDIKQALAKYQPEDQDGDTDEG